MVDICIARNMDRLQMNENRKKKTRLLMWGWVMQIGLLYYDGNKEVIVCDQIKSPCKYILYRIGKR